MCNRLLTFPTSSLSSCAFHAFSICLLTLKAADALRAEVLLQADCSRQAEVHGQDQYVLLHHFIGIHFVALIAVVIGKSRQACFTPLVYKENKDERTRSSRSEVLGYMVSWNNLIKPAATDSTSFVWYYFLFSVLQLMWFI